MCKANCYAVAVTFPPIEMLDVKDELRWVLSIPTQEITENIILLENEGLLISLSEEFYQAASW